MSSKKNEKACICPPNECSCPTSDLNECKCIEGNKCVCPKGKCACSEEKCVCKTKECKCIETQQCSCPEGKCTCKKSKCSCANNCTCCSDDKGDYTTEKKCRCSNWVHVLIICYILWKIWSYLRSINEYNYFLWYIKFFGYGRCQLVNVSTSNTN